MSENTAGLIDVTGVPLEKLMRTAYAMSSPQGLGFIHATEGGLDDETLAEILERGKTDTMYAISTDYVRGRSLKFRVRRIDGRHYLRNQWYDHSTRQLKELLSEVGLSPDLVDTARAEETAYHERIKDAAVAYLREHGGAVRQNRGLRTMPKPEEELPPEVDAGLWWALDAKLVTEEYGDDGYTTWTLA